MILHQPAAGGVPAEGAAAAGGVAGQRDSARRGRAGRESSARCGRAGRGGSARCGRAGCGVGLPRPVSSLRRPGGLFGGGGPRCHRGGLLCGAGAPCGRSGRLCGGGLLHRGRGEVRLRDVPSPAREEPARCGEPRACRPYPGQAVAVVGPVRDAGGGPWSADQQHPGGDVIGQMLAQQRLVEGVAGLLRPGMGVHVDQPGHQPAAIHYRVGARRRALAEHPAVDPQGALFPLRQHDSPHMQHHVPCLSARPGGANVRGPAQSAGCGPVEPAGCGPVEPAGCGPREAPDPATGAKRILDTAADILNGMGRAS